MAKRINDKWIRTKDDEKAYDLGYEFIEENGHRVIRFIEKYFRPEIGVNHYEMLDWVKDATMMLFGWIRPNTISAKYPRGLRRFFESCVGVPRQNGKSHAASGWCFNQLINDGEINGNIWLAGVNEKQTEDTIFSHIANSVRANNWEDLIQIKKSKGDKHIIYPATNSSIRCLTQTGAGKLGPSVSFCVLEEFSFHEKFELFENLKASPSARAQPLTISISTSGKRRDTPAYDRWLHARGIQKGLVSDIGFFPLLYESEPSEDIQDEKVWYRCNPSLGKTLNLDIVKRTAELAKASPREELTFRSWRLNQWVSSLSQFINLDAWAACTVKPEDWPVFPKGAIAYNANDLSCSVDLTSSVTLIPHEGNIYVEHFSWACREGASYKEPQNIPMYEECERNKTIHICEGNVIDFDMLLDHFAMLKKKYTLRSVKFDASHNANHIFLTTERMGYPAQRFVGSPKNYNDPLRRLDELVMAGKLKHKGDAMINYQVQNLECKEHGDLVYPVLANPAMKRDVMIALIIAVDSYMYDQATKPKFQKIQRW